MAKSRAQKQERLARAKDSLPAAMRLSNNPQSTPATTAVAAIEVTESSLAPIGPTSRLDPLVPGILAIVVVTLTICHVYYALNSGMVPSTDEAHYMSGAVSISNGIRTGTLSGAWAGYLNALIYKPPLVCVPAALFMLLGQGLLLPAFLSLSATFAGLGYASYRLFRKCVTPLAAACATVILLTTPLITGLTHRFYVELLLLLITACYLLVLTREPWRSWRYSALLGVFLGLGMLTKTTFPLVALPTAWSLAMTVVPLRREVLRIAGIGGRVLLVLSIAAIVAIPWYAHNLQHVIHHAQLAAGSMDCYFPHWIAADLSSGPGLPIAGAALLGLLGLVPAWISRKIGYNPGNAWILTLLLGIATAIAVTASINKATRFQVTWLPAFALLAVAAPIFLLPGRFQSGVMIVLAALGIMQSIQLTFGILPIQPVRWGEFRLFDSHYPLNIPDWFDDNHPLDRRSYPLAQVGPIVAADAAERINAGAAIKARTTELGLLINHDYLALLSTARKERVDYSWWPGSVKSGPDAPDYIVHTRGFGQFYPGVQFFQYFPTIDMDLASGRLNYDVLKTLPGPSGSEVVILRKKGLTALGGTPGGETLTIEAESFQRGNATIDDGKYGYGAGIGVILSPQPPVHAEYDFKMDAAGEYQVDIRYASVDSRPIRVVVDGVVLSNRAADVTTGGFDPAHQQWQPIGLVHLEAGKHVMRVESLATLPHIDQFSLTRVVRK